MSEHKQTNTLSNNKRFAKNSLILYIRMFFSMIVGLYTSRVVLNTLGVEDYGIYGTVGGLISMMAILNTTMSGATARFITFELGKDDKKKLSETFSSALIIHVIIAAFVLIVCETIGLWYLNFKMVIPTERIVASNWVYQFSVISILFTITQVPYNSCIIAHEKMNIYAYVEIINVVLKLLIVFLLQALEGDKLIIYSILVLIVSVLIMSFYKLYCLRHFEEAKFHFVWKPQILKPIISFSGWDLYGNFASVARLQGVNLIINLFFGPALNAASIIATTVSNLISQFSGNVLIAIKPQIIKSYAQNEFEETNRLIFLGCIINFILFSMMAIPLISEMNYILSIWLKKVPNYTVEFCQLSLVCAVFTSLTLTVLTGIHATGKLKLVGIILGTTFLLVLPGSYFPYKLGLKIEWLPFAINIITGIVGLFACSYILHRYMQQFSFKKMSETIIFKFVIPFVVILSVTRYIDSFLEESFFRLILSTIISSFTLLVISYFWIIPKEVKPALKYIIKKYIDKIIKTN